MCCIVWLVMLSDAFKYSLGVRWESVSISLIWVTWDGRVIISAKWNAMTNIRTISMAPTYLTPTTSAFSLLPCPFLFKYHINYDQILSTRYERSMFQCVCVSVMDFNFTLVSFHFISLKFFTIDFSAGMNYNK